MCHLIRCLSCATTSRATDKARSKALTDVATKYHGSAEGSVAAMYQASDAADKGLSLIHI